MKPKIYVKAEESFKPSVEEDFKNFRHITKVFSKFENNRPSPRNITTPTSSWITFFVSEDLTTDVFVDDSTLICYDHYNTLFFFTRWPSVHLV